MKGEWLRLFAYLEREFSEKIFISGVPRVHVKGDKKTCVILPPKGYGWEQKWTAADHKRGERLGWEKDSHFFN